MGSRTAYKLFTFLVANFFIASISSSSELSEQEQAKERIRSIAEGYRSSSSGVSDSNGNNVDVLERSRNTIRVDENTTGSLGNAADDMDFSSNASINMHSKAFESKLVQSGDESSEGKVFSLLKGHRESQEYQNPNSDHENLVNNMTLVNDDPDTNPFLSEFQQLEASAAAGTVCRTVDPGSSSEVREVITDEHCSEQTGTIYMESSCTVKRNLIAPIHQVPDFESHTVDGNKNTYEITTVGEQEFSFSVSNKELVNFKLDIEESSNSVVATLNGNIILQYGVVTENAARYLVEGENKVAVTVQDSEWKNDEWEYQNGMHYGCLTTPITLLRGKLYARCVALDDFGGYADVYDDPEWTDAYDELRLSDEKKHYAAVPYYKKRGSRKTWSAVYWPGPIVWGEWNIRTYPGHFAHRSRESNSWASVAIKCKGTRNNSDCVFGSLVSDTRSEAISAINTAVSHYNERKPGYVYYKNQVLHYESFDRGLESSIYNWVPVGWQGENKFTLSFEHPELIENIREIPEGCITDPSSITIDVIGGPILTKSVGLSVPQAGSSKSPYNLSNDTWLCVDGSTSRAIPGAIAKTVDSSDYIELTEMYPGEKSNPQGICLEAKARKFLVDIKNASACDDGTFACYGSQYSTLPGGLTAWEALLGGYKGCSEFKDQDSCNLSGSTCEIMNSDTGECTYTNYTYQCSKEITTTTPGLESGVVCTTTLPCSGEDVSCGELQSKPSDSFARTAGILSAATVIGQEGDCYSDDPASCVLFGGEKKVCRSKVTFAGIGGKDCCENPTDFTTADAIRLGLAIASTDYFQSMVAAIYDAVYQAAADAFYEIMGEQATQAAADAAASAAANSAASSSASAASSSAASAGASSAGSAGATASSSTAATSSTMSALGSAVSVVGGVYTAYVIAKAIYDIGTQCDDRDFDTAYYVGTGQCLYYDKDCVEDSTFGGCEEEESYYCCYSSPFSKHLNKEIYDKGLSGRQLAVNPANCEGFTIDELASLEWDKITLQGWIDELSAGGLIPSTEVVGGVSDEGNVYANSLSADQQADLESQLAIIRQEPINSADDYFSEENMVDLVGRVTSDPNAATASSNAEEVFSEYDGENIEDRRAQTRKGLLLDNLYEQHYEFCDYEHFNPLGYSYEKLQRYVVDENGERIDRGEL